MRKLEPDQMIDTRLMRAALGDHKAAGPRVALFVSDRLRWRHFADLVDQAPVGEADATLVDLAPGETAPALPPPLLLLTDDPQLLAEPQAAGVLPRGATVGQVMAAISAIAQGLEVRVRAVERSNKVRVERPKLTPRELQILLRVGEGQSNKVIARGLGISAHTVKYHLEAVFNKLGARTRAEAISIGLRRGLVKPGSMACV